MEGSRSNPDSERKGKGRTLLGCKSSNWKGAGLQNLTWGGEAVANTGNMATKGALRGGG